MSDAGIHQPRDWYRLPADDALRHLDTDRGGLSRERARERARRHGPNRVRTQTGVSPWRILLAQFASPLIYVLAAALAVTLSIGNWADAIVIGLVLVVNTTVGFAQEYRAESAVQSLMEMVSPRARVRRGGQEADIAADALVPGDIVLLTQGEVVPADLRLIDVRGLQVDEAPLTGESVPVSKVAHALADAEANLPPADQRNMAFMGTAATSGHGQGVVVAIGARTEIGQIAEQVQQAERVQTPLQRRIDRLARWITVAVLAVAAVAVAAGLLLGRDLTEMLLLAVALAVAAIPAGLPVVVTVALAIGVRRMARRNAVIRHLPAVDTLGSCTTILSDKTGTLTQNRMTVRAIVAGGERFSVGDDAGGRRAAILLDDREIEPERRQALHETLLVGLLCNDAMAGETPPGDPMEIALLSVARAAGMSRADLAQRHPLRETVPFRTEQRYMATIHDAGAADGGPVVVVKGAPERVAAMCDTLRTADGGEVPLSVEDVVDDSETLAAEGLRVLAMAMGQGEAAVAAAADGRAGGLTFVGMQGLLDPPRQTAVDAVDRCHDAGIRVVMVTGDHATTAAAIGRQVHLDRPVRAPGGEADGGGRRSDTRAHMEVCRGPDIAALDDDGLDDALDRVNVYARVTPQQKLRLVERLKARDEIVAATGDGVNDAPALEAAHLGAAMGSGTDVAKESSDMVISDDNFASVHAAVEEGRTAFRNIRMATFFLLSTGAADVLIILSALGLGWALPLLPAQLLWVNVVTNGIADVALAFEPGEPALYRRPPRPPGEGVLDRVLIERLALVGVWLAAGTLAVFYWQWGGEPGNLAVARTAAVTTLVLFQKVHVFNCRSEDASIFHTRLLANKVLFIGVLSSLTLHIAAIYLPWTQGVLRLAPIGPTTWAVAAAVAATAIVVNEAHKRLRPRHHVRHAT